MKSKLIVIVMLVLTPFFAQAQDGVIDMSFGDGGYAIADFNSRRDIVMDLKALQNDEKIIVMVNR